jgi:hypothetical protein
MDSMTLAKARMISEKLHQLILMQVLRDEDLEDIGRIFIRASLKGLLFQKGCI